MTLNHPCGASIRVEVFWDNALWYDVTDDIRALTIETDRRTPLTDIFEPGRLVMQLDNRQRQYDPIYPSGPYFGNLKPGRLVRAAINGTDVWWGFIDQFALDYHKSNRDGTVTITCVTPLARAATVIIPAGTTPAFVQGESTASRGSRLNVATNGVSISWPSWANNPTDYTPRCSDQDRWDATRDHNVRDELAKLAALEQAPVISSQTSNEVLIYPRHWFQQYDRARGVGSVGFGQFGLPFHDLQVRFDADDIITAVSMTDESGNAVVAIDTAGEADYGTRYPSVSYSEIPSLNDEDLEGAARSALKLRGGEAFRIESLTVKPAAHPSIAASLDDLPLLAQIAVAWTPTGVGGVIVDPGYSIIVGITHDITREDWTTTYALRPYLNILEAVNSSFVHIIGTSFIGGTHVVGL